MLYDAIFFYNMNNHGSRVKYHDRVLVVDV